MAEIDAQFYLPNGFDAETIIEGHLNTGNTGSLDLAKHRVFTHDHDNTNFFNIVFTFYNPPPTGTTCAFLVIVKGDNTARTIFWPSTVKWYGSEPRSTAANKTDVFMFITKDGGSSYQGWLLMGDMV